MTSTKKKPSDLKSPSYLENDLKRQLNMMDQLEAMTTKNKKKVKRKDSLNESNKMIKTQHTPMQSLRPNSKISFNSRNAAQ